MLKYFAILLTFIQFACGTEVRTNVLFIAIDDLNDRGIPGLHPEVKTPNIDRLAAMGTSFTKAYCAAPACNPSRASVITGIHPATSGVYFNQQEWKKNPVLRDVPTIPHHFREEGYTTLGGGKIYHAASLSEAGFCGLLDPDPWDVFYPSKERQLAPEVLPSIVPTNGNSKFYRGFFDWALLQIADKEMGDAKVVHWATGELSKTHSKPLFLAVGIYRPHIPWYTPQKYFDLYPIDDISLPEVIEDDFDDIPESGQEMARRHWHKWIADEGKWKAAIQGYLASVTFADAMVGQLLDALEKGPLADNTAIVLWSDHGYHLGHKEHWKKFALWEQATHVPLIFAAPGLPKGQECHHPVSLLDVYPTLIELTGTTSRPRLDGTSLVPWLRDHDKESNRAILTTQGYKNHAVRSADFRYIRYADGGEELYDHRKDPNEFTNLARNPEYQSTIESHKLWLPEKDAELNPPNTQKKKSK
ncbi:MAG: sulfatase [Verrucomicrobiales bacterium]|nr:sulfatase [Verrucomicrobiales bacterium]